MTYQEVTKLFFQATIATLGAFFPILILMYAHFKLRKDFYAKASDIHNKFLELHNNEIKTVTQNLENIYTQFKVNNLNELIGTLNTGLNVPEEVMNIASYLEKRKREIDIDIIKKLGEIEHLKSYTFKDYLVGLLNDTYPDPYWSSK